MRKIKKKLEDIFAAIAFAEAGEVETAREILKSQESEVKGQELKTKESQPMTQGPQLSTDPDV